MFPLTCSGFYFYFCWIVFIEELRLSLQFCLLFFRAGDSKKDVFPLGHFVVAIYFPHFLLFYCLFFSGC